MAGTGRTKGDGEMGHSRARKGEGGEKVAPLKKLNWRVRGRDDSLQQEKRLVYYSQERWAKLLHAPSFNVG